jgi:hypothetical protein
MKDFDFVELLDDFIKDNMSYTIIYNSFANEEIFSIIKSFKENLPFHRLYLTNIPINIGIDINKFCKKLGYSYGEVVDE